MEDGLQLAFSFMAVLTVLLFLQYCPQDCTSLLRYSDHDDYSHMLQNILVVNSADGNILVGLISQT